MTSRDGWMHSRYLMTLWFLILVVVSERVERVWGIPHFFLGSDSRVFSVFSWFSGFLWFSMVHISEAKNWGCEGDGVRYGEMGGFNWIKYYFWRGFWVVVRLLVFCFAKCLRWVTFVGCAVHTVFTWRVCSPASCLFFSLFGRSASW